MADLKQILDPSQLKTDLLKQQPSLIDYDEVVDVLRIYFGDPKKRSVVHYLDDYVGILFSPSDMAIVGIQVDYFEKKFIKKHESIENSWKITDNCKDHNLENIGEMMFFTKKRQEPIVREITNITKSLLFNPGNKKEYVYA